MVICETCQKPHDGNYGSGRFCDVKCARSFSTKLVRNKINEKVSASLKGRPCAHNKGFKSGHDPRRYIFTSDVCKEISIRRWKRVDEALKACEFEYIPPSRIRNRILKEQNYKCLMCGTGEIWNGQKLVLQLDHINGNSKDNSRKNLRILCPNCHTQTDTWGRKTRK